MASDGGGGGSEFPHEPVMVQEVLSWLEPERGGVFVDATLGAGGHAQAVLEVGGPRVRLVGMDQDPYALELAAERLAPYGDRAVTVRSNFRAIEQVLDDLGCGPAAGILFDLGVSSMHFDQADRGFSYREDGPLDMRMDPDGPLTAAHIVNAWSHGQLARILREYGQERWAGRIASFIVEARARRRVESTSELVDIIKAAIPAAARRRGGHPARRTFQALRIAVNDELGVLQSALEGAARRLAAGGRIVVISFHSLEDRVVKREFRRLAQECDCPPGRPCTCGNTELLEVLTRRPVTPGQEELARNPRARSAKLRAARRRGPVSV